MKIVVCHLYNRAVCVIIGQKPVYICFNLLSNNVTVQICDPAPTFILDAHSIPMRFVKLGH